MNCGCRWCYPIPHAEEIIQFYSNGHHPHHAIEDQESQKEHFMVIQRLRMLAPTARTLLDVGCGFGHYLRVAIKHGYQCVGVELDPERACIAQATGAEIIAGVFSPELMGNRVFDLIIFNHVIEHVTEPIELLKGLRAHLAPGGILFVATPNFRGLNALMMGQHFSHYTPPEHVVYFSKRSLEACLQRIGFVVVRRDGYCHPEEFKTLLAHLIKFRWIRSRSYMELEQDIGLQVGSDRLHRFRGLKQVISRLVILIGHTASPLIKTWGPDHLHYYATHAASVETNAP